MCAENIKAMDSKFNSGTGSNMRSTMWLSLACVFLVSHTLVAGEEIEVIRCTGEMVDMACPDNLVIRVTMATYGYYGNRRCNVLPFECSEDVTKEIRQVADGLQATSFRVALDIVNMKCSRYADEATLVLTYQCVSNGTDTSSTTTISAAPSTTPTTTTTTIPTTTTPDRGQLSIYDHHTWGSCLSYILTMECQQDHVMVIQDTTATRDLACGSLPEVTLECKTPKLTAHVTARCSGKRTCQIQDSTKKIAQYCRDVEQNRLTVDYICVPYYHILDVCDDNLDTKYNTFGFVGSPGYPRKYRKNLRCVQDLYSPSPDTYFMVSVKDLHLEARSTAGCYDFIRLFDIENRAFVFNEYCGTLGDYKSDLLTFAAYNVSMDFLTNGIVDQSRRGFLIYYEMRSQSTQEGLSTNSPLPTPESTTTTSSRPPTTTKQTTTTTRMVATTTAKVDTSNVPRPFEEVSKAVTCEQSEMELACPPGKIILVLEAVYGQVEGGTCTATNSQSDDSHQCLPERVTDYVMGSCDKKNTCSMYVWKSSFGYSCPVQSDGLGLQVKYICTEAAEIVNICDQTRAALPPEGYLISPSFPQAYGKNFVCSRDVKSADPEARVLVHVLHVDVSNRLTSDTCYDRLELKEEDVLAERYDLCSYKDWTGEEFVFRSLVASFHADRVETDHVGFLVYYKAFRQDGEAVEIVPDITTVPTAPPTTTISTVATTTSPPLTPHTPAQWTCSSNQPISITCDSATDVILIENVYETSSCTGMEELGQADMCEEAKMHFIQQCTGRQSCNVPHDADAISSCSNILAVEYRCFKAPTSICDPLPTTQRSGLISSSDFPSAYRKNQECTVRITTPLPDDTIRVRLYALDVERRDTSPGCYDRLYMEEEGNALQYYEVCGTINDPVIQPANTFVGKLLLRFRSNGVPNGNRGFLLYYEVITDVPLETTAETPEQTSTATTSTVATSTVTTSTTRSTQQVTEQETTSANVHTTEKPLLKPVEKKSKNKGGMIAGIIIAILIILLILAVLGYIYYKRRYGRSPFVRKPGRSDLTANTSEMNAQTYVELPTPAVYDMRGSSLSAHESALMDKNKNLSLTRDESEQTAGALRRHGQYNPGFEYDEDLDSAKPVPLSNSPSMEGSDGGSVAVDTDNKSPLIINGPDGGSGAIPGDIGGSRAGLELYDDIPPGSYKTHTVA